MQYNTIQCWIAWERRADVGFPGLGQRVRVGFLPTPTPPPAPSDGRGRPAASTIERHRRRSARTERRRRGRGTEGDLQGRRAKSDCLEPPVGTQLPSESVRTLQQRHSANSMDDFSALNNKQQHSTFIRNKQQSSHFLPHSLFAE